jgi:hypothetical protein
MRSASLAVVLALVANGCAIARNRPVPEVKDPRAPLACNPDLGPSQVDRAVGWSLVALSPAVLVVTLGVCANVGPDSPRCRPGWAPVMAAVGAGFLVSAWRGGTHVRACVEARAHQEACAQGLDASCQRLLPGWSPPGDGAPGPGAADLRARPAEVLAPRPTP